MYFGLSEEQSFFQDNVKKYLEEHATIDNIKHIASGDEKNLSAEIHQGLLNLGINGLLIPEEFGGLGLDLLFAAVVSEALGGGVGPTPFIAPYVMAPTAIRHAGSQSQQKNYLSKIATNEYSFGVGFSEFIGKRNDAGITFSDRGLNGRTMFVLDANDATHLLLTDEKGQIFVVDAKSASSASTPNANFVDAILNGADVSANATLGLRVAQLTEALYASAAEHRPVEIR